MNIFQRKETGTKKTLEKRERKLTCSLEKKNFPKEKIPGLVKNFQNCAKKKIAPKNVCALKKNEKKKFP